MGEAKSFGRYFLFWIYGAVFVFLALALLEPLLLDAFRALKVLLRGVASGFALCVVGHGASSLVLPVDKLHGRSRLGYRLMACMAGLGRGWWRKWGRWRRRERVNGVRCAFGFHLD